MKIKFCDLNHNLVDRVRELGIEAYCEDYFMFALSVPRHVLVTASNPNYTFGGGIDAIFKSNFSLYCEAKQYRRSEMERIGNICFCVTVGDDLKATKEQVKKAIQFAIDNTYEGETLLLSGVGTGIGGLSEDTFCEILKELLVHPIRGKRK
jgi:hypothetical protein